MPVDYIELQKRVLASLEKIPLDENNPNASMMKSLYEQMAMVAVMAIAEYQRMLENG